MLFCISKPATDCFCFPIWIISLGKEDMERGRSLRKTASALSSSSLFLPA